MTDAHLQKDLFQHIRNTLPPHVSMVNEIADLLHISYDSVYRRIRGEKPVTLDELKLLCEHFHLSLDQVLQLHTDKILFTDTEANGNNQDFLHYLQGLIRQLQYFNSFKHRRLFYLSKDIPVFYFFYFHELAAFKSFFWSKSILNDPAFDGKNFSLSDFDASAYFAAGQTVLKEYNQIPGAELWNYESINSTISQIEYYRDAGIFESKDDLDKVVDSCDAMLQHIQKQVEKGCKFLPGIGEAGYGAPIQFYINEIILGNNSIMVETDDTKMAFINHIVLKYISTTDKKFTEKAFANFQNLVSRSVLISETGEKERNRFFKTLREKIQACRK
ncbi:MAG: hypothetical protein JST86_12950 [Bacteroidetes bacterium]|nr:hypothetical protein [Bacteroidota bacterium]